MSTLLTFEPEKPSDSVKKYANGINTNNAKLEKRKT